MVIEEYTLDRGRGESSKAFSTSHPPLTHGPLVGVVSHTPPVPPNEVIFLCNVVHVVYLH